MTVTDGANVGDHCVIGAGAVVVVQGKMDGFHPFVHLGDGEVAGVAGLAQGLDVQGLFEQFQGVEEDVEELDLGVVEHVPGLLVHDRAEDQGLVPPGLFEDVVQGLAGVVGRLDEGDLLLAEADVLELGEQGLAHVLGENGGGTAYIVDVFADGHGRSAGSFRLWQNRQRNLGGCVSGRGATPCGP